MQKILVLAANPKTTSRLRLDEELRDIEAGLRRAQHRDEFAFAQRLAVGPRQLSAAAWWKPCWTLGARRRPPIERQLWSHTQTVPKIMLDRIFLL